MNVTLRLIKEDDLPLIQHYLSIEDVSRMTNVPEPYPPNGAKEWFGIVSEEHLLENHYPFTILADDEFAGSISVRREREGIGAIDYWVAPPFWKKGIGTKAAEQAVNFGRQALKRLKLAVLLRIEALPVFLRRSDFEKGRNL